MKCDKAREMIFDFLDSGEIGGSLEEHLENCESCRNEFDNLKSAISTLTPATKLDPEEGFTARVMEQIGKDSLKVTPISRKPTKSMFAKVIGIAATLLIIFNLPFFDIARDDLSKTDKEKKEAFSLLSAAFAAESTFKSQGIMHWETQVKMIPTINRPDTWAPLESPREGLDKKHTFLHFDNNNKKGMHIYYDNNWYDADSGYFARLIQDENRAAIFACCFDGTTFYFLERDSGGNSYEYFKNDPNRSFNEIEKYINGGYRSGLSSNIENIYDAYINDNKTVKTVRRLQTDNNQEYTGNILPDSE